MEEEYRCEHCHKSDVLLLRLTDTTFICDDCIRKQEKRDDTVAVYFYTARITFVSRKKSDLVAYYADIIASGQMVIRHEGGCIYPYPHPIEVVDKESK